VYQGYEPEPNQQVNEDPLSFEDANHLACELQGETGGKNQRQTEKQISMSLSQYLKLPTHKNGQNK
jgi:hypothetical protein